MQPIYFPYTYITEDTLAGLLACFQSVLLYQPTRLNLPPEIRLWHDRGFIELRIPLLNDEQEIAAKLKGFRRWGGIHQKNHLERFKFANDFIPFFGETSTAKIRAEIKNSDPPPILDQLINTRLFLQFAQEFDRQNEELNHQLNTLAVSEKMLYENLQGELAANSADGLPGEKGPRETGWNYMVPERFSAWARLYLYDQKMNKYNRPMLFVTHRSAVIDFLKEKAVDMRKTVMIDSLPLTLSDSREAAHRRKKIDEKIRLLANASRNAIERYPVEIPVMHKTGGQTAGMTIYAILGESPYDFFSRHAGFEATGQAKSGDMGQRNLLIGLLELKDNK